MGVSGGFPIDIILFGMIAAFLVLRLKRILGRRTGFERPAASPMSDGPAPIHEAAPAAPPPSRALPDPTSTLGQTLGAMQATDPHFSPAGFLDGAEKAFRIIVHAYATGDRAALRPLLGDDTWNAFDHAITGREKSGQAQVLDVKAVHAMVIEGAALKGAIAQVTVRITSDQVNMTNTTAGQVVTGTDAVTEISDIWTFERDLSQPNPAWHLVAARSA